MERNFFGTLLGIYLRDGPMNQKKIANAVGVHPSQITRLCRGELPGSPERAEAIARAMSNDLDIQTNLIVAYLLDHCPPAYRSLVEIRNTNGDPPSAFDTIDRAAKADLVSG